jgi:hypothetical protein
MRPETGAPLCFRVSTFAHKRDNRPKLRELTIDALAAWLTTYAERSDKNGPLWSPARYLDGATRGNAQVRDVAVLAMEYDGAEPPWERFDGLWFVAHTTWSHAEDDPHWRIVVPLAVSMKRGALTAPDVRGLHHATGGPKP